MSDLFIKAQLMLMDTAGDLGLGDSQSGTSVGKTIIGNIKSIGTVVGLVLAVLSVVMIAITLIVSRRQEERTEAMTRILYVAGGLLLIGVATAIVGYVASTFSL